MRRWTFPAFAAVMLLLPLLPVPDFWITQSIYIGLYSLDGASHNVSCTAVSGWRESGYVYSTKNWVVTNTEVGHPDSYMVWNAGDFGGTAGDQITSSLAFSITCLLPPQTAIDYIQGELKYEIGT